MRIMDIPPTLLDRSYLSSYIYGGYDILAGKNSGAGKNMVVFSENNFRKLVEIFVRVLAYASIRDWEGYG